MSELGQYIQLVDEIVDGDLTRLHSDWRQFDLVVDDRACAARVVARIETQDLVEYAVADQNNLVRTGLRWIEHKTGQRELVVDIGDDVDYWNFSNAILSLLAYDQVQWLGFPDGGEHVPRPKMQYDDRLSLRMLMQSGDTPVGATTATVRPFVLSHRGAANVLAAWTGEPVEVQWRDKKRSTWRGILEQTQSPESLQLGLYVQALSDSRDDPPSIGDHVTFGAMNVSRVYNLTRDSMLVNLHDMWDYRPTIASTKRKKPFTRDVNVPFTQEDINALVVLVHAGGETDVSTEEIVQRWLAGGFWGDCQLGSSAYWLLHPVEKEEPGEEEEEDNYDDEDEGTPLFIYELAHSDGEKALIAVRTSNWSSFDGGPSWSDYDERIYLSMEAIQGAYGDGCEIEMVG
jgi:hypothetical protein